ncbi:MAG: tRNA dimethylallyltransferase [Patescibacteria group bacterium]
MPNGKSGNWTLANWKLVMGSELEIVNLQNAQRFVGGVPQWLIDIADPGERFTLFDWLPLAQLAIEDIFSRGKIPIIVGGTGLYIQALVEGFKLESKLLGANREGGRGSGSAPAFVREHNSADLSANSLSRLRAELRQVDPEAYEKIDSNNPHRLKRAIERAREGLAPTKIKPSFGVLQIGMELPRFELYRRIDDRVEGRFSEGMLEEIIALLFSGVSPAWLLNLGLEYRIISQFVLSAVHSPDLISKNLYELELATNKVAEKSKNARVGASPIVASLSPNISNIAIELKQLSQYEEMKQDLKYKIHAFARRQLIWFRRFPEIYWERNYDRIILPARDYLEKPTDSLPRSIC